MIFVPLRSMIFKMREWRERRICGGRGGFVEELLGFWCYCRDPRRVLLFRLRVTSLLVTIYTESCGPCFLQLREIE